MHNLFGTKHLILIAISVILIVGLYFLSRKLRLKTISKILFGVGIVSEAVKIFYYIIQNEQKYGGVLPKTDLPFHLCSIQIIFIAIIVISQSEKLKRFILSFMLPSCLFGGIAAILLATTSSLNGTWVITAQFFLYHVAITVFALYLLTSKEFKLELKDFVNCLKFLVIIMFFSIYINSILYDGINNINFMYVVSPPVKGLPYLNEDKGWLVYILRYLLLVIACITICYIKPIVCSIKTFIKNKKQKTQENESLVVENENKTE